MVSARSRDMNLHSMLQLISRPVELKLLDYHSSFSGGILHMHNFAPQQPIIVHVAMGTLYLSAGPKAEGHQLTTDKQRS
jgi:hypothetical protein